MQQLPAVGVDIILFFHTANHRRYCMSIESHMLRLIIAFIVWLKRWVLDNYLVAANYNKMECWS